MTPWLRLWRDMPADPKFRTIAKKSGRPVSDVISIFVTMMVAADDAGRIDSWRADDCAAGLDLAVDHVEAVESAMQGKVLDGRALSGWEKRQPKREDGSAERAREWRERKRTQANAEKRPDTESETDTDTDKSLSSVPIAARDEVKFKKPVSDGKGREGKAAPFATVRKRAEGLGLPVEELDAEASSADNKPAKFTAEAVKRLQIGRAHV